MVILRRGAQHRRSADVDVLDGFVIGAVGPRNGFRERVEVHGEKVDRRNVVQLHDGVVDAAAAEQTAVNARVQRLDTAVHDLRKARIR